MKNLDFLTLELFGGATEEELRIEFEGLTRAEILRYLNAMWPDEEDNYLITEDIWEWLN